jgi:hypothetical protein
MADMPYRIVAPNSPDNIALYHKLAKDYWNWIQGKDPDSDPRNPKDPNVTFLRDDIIGQSLYHQVGISNGRGSKEAGPLEKNISVKRNARLFFPVYHVCSVTEHPYVKGGKCGTIANCKDAARIDLDNCFEKFAKINDADIALENHHIETDEFDLEVPYPNDLNREAGFNLPPGKYPGVAAGTYVCVENLQSGSYEFYFGGRATDFHTESKYKVTVEE